MYHRYNTQELCNAIYLAVSVADRPLSRHEICEKIGRHKSPHIVSMINHLNEVGYLQRTVMTNERHNQEFRYYVGDKPTDEVGADLWGA
jgi:hypothetical protein